MKRTTMSLIGAVAALAAVTGAAAVAAPGEDAGSTTAKAATLPVQRSALTCPAPTSSEVGETTYTAFTPQGEKAGKGSASLRPAADGRPDDTGKKGKDAKSPKKGDDKPVAPLKAPGTPVTQSTDRSDAPALIGTADGGLAPGWSVQQTTEVSAGTGRGVLGTACTAPDTDFWFPGASTSPDRQDYVHLTNPDDTAAVVDLKLYGKDGGLKGTSGEDIQVPPHASVPVLLSTLSDTRAANVTLHVSAREGRVGAAVQAGDDKLGGDWLPATADPASAGSGLVLPGIPADATSVRLVALAPGSADADLKVQLATPTGAIVPAGLETLHLKSGATTAVDLKDLTKGEAGSLVLTPTDGSKAPVTAALRVVRGKGADQEMAFIPATRPVGTRATVADNRAKGSTLSLVAPQKGKDARVKVTASAGSGGGSPVSRTYTVKGGSTLAVQPPRPNGLKGSYALTVEPEKGTGPVYAARTLALPHGGVQGFTVQTLPDDRGLVEVPTAGWNMSVLND
ncbi:hypothetical protein C3486_16955 [Streptomyces sp. Ru73]|uniref:DUF5719 family protein n=1 Tax=Streptomyces sp. Ru73 TaxID=2080748 RepID=UPI000CDD1A3C|nr:DUF5719 family protein [Streptomyces sp. Ru73]POX39694.1 hypothetical protein C3486_16955 [Streptomyces sp. Ru73]